MATTNALTNLEQIVDEITNPDQVGAELLDRVLELYFLALEQVDDTDENDTESCDSALERIAYACGPETRAEIANRLAQHPRAPKRLMRCLAFDIIIVSRPVLQYSNCLSDRDLVTLIRKLGEEHHLAIAHRLKLHEMVTDALIERGTSPVLTTLVQNTGAEISREGQDKLLKLMKSDPELEFILSLRSDLDTGPLTKFRDFIAARLFETPSGEEHASPATAAEILAMEEPEETGDGEVAAEQGQSRSSGTGDRKDTRPGGHAVERDPMPPEYDISRFGTSSEHALAEMARVGWVSGTVSCLSRLAKIDEKMARHCLMTADLSALMVLCKARGFQNGTFTALLHLRDARNAEDSDRKIDIVGMLKRYEAMKPHTAKRIIQFADKKKEAAHA